MRAQCQERHAAETSEEREDRLQHMRDQGQERRAAETSEQREDRLQRTRGHEMSRTTLESCNHEMRNCLLLFHTSRARYSHAKNYKHCIKPPSYQTMTRDHLQCTRSGSPHIVHVQSSSSLQQYHRNQNAGFQQ